MSEHGPTPGEAPRWLDTPAAGRRIHNVLAVFCGLLVLGDFLYHKHAHFDFEAWPGFYAAAGFLSYVSLVTVAKGLRKLIKRPETYYEDGDAERGEGP